jgi:hypothetical protein
MLWAFPIETRWRDIVHESVKYVWAKLMGIRFHHWKPFESLNIPLFYLCDAQKLSGESVLRG